jgi:hypothetical protein
LTYRLGPSSANSVLTSLVGLLERLRGFSDRLREFLGDVTRCGLQKQHEAVCENVGLIAFLMQTEQVVV